MSQPTALSQRTENGESSWRPLRLIHASDLRLDLPPHGMVDDPDHLRPRLVDCPYDAARNVFDAALVESVDALVLSGNTVEIDLAGPRALVFLEAQFARLAEKGIPVYWAGGATDPPGAWPPAASLPENVHIFPAGRIESHTLTRDGKPVARIVGTSLGRGDTIPLDRIRRDADALLTIGVACGPLDRDAFERSRVDFLALGGRHERSTTTLGRQVAHYPGTPQGRSPAKPGPRGCTLVEFDHEHKISLKSIATDTLRFHTEKVDVHGAMTLSTLERQLCDRVKSLSAKAGDRDLIVTWRLGGDGRHLGELRRGGAEGVISRLRERFGHKSPAVWSVELVAQPTAKLPEDWFEQETILGDVLRRFDQLESDPAASLDLSNYLSDADRDGPLATLADLSTGRRRSDVLRDAAILSASLLAGSSTGKPDEV